MSHPALPQIYEAFEAGLDFMMADMPDAWIVREENLRAVSAPLPWPAFNGLSITGPVEHAQVAAHFHRVEAAGNGCSITTRPDTEAFAASAIDAFGLTPAPRPDPLMMLPLTGTSVSAYPADFVIQRVDVNEIDALVDLAAEGFEMPRWMAELTNTPALLSSPTAATYFGKVDGVAVAMGVGARYGDVVGLFSICTLPAYRGRGYGAAITERIGADAFVQGCSLAYLQSSPMGQPVYERLGYTTIETWTTYQKP
jgi:GNAT superfamily N-acetyltransferase